MLKALNLVTNVFVIEIAKFQIHIFFLMFFNAENYFQERLQLVHRNTPQSL